MVSTTITRHRPARGATRDRRVPRAAAPAPPARGMPVARRRAARRDGGARCRRRHAPPGPVSAASAPRVSTFSSVARTSGSNAAGGTPAASASRAACPSSATRWLDATVAAAWYATRSASFTRNGRMPSETASRSTSSGPSTAHHEPGSRATPISGDGNDCNGWSDPTSTSGRATAQLVQLVERAHAGAVDHERAGAQARRDRGRDVGDGGVGGGDQHEVGVGADEGERRVRGRRAAPRRGAPRASRARARRPRPASIPGRPWRAPAWSRRGRAPRGRTPAACDRATE